MYGAPAHNMLTEVPFSQGDDAGVEMGVASGMVMGPCRHMPGAFTVLVVDLTGQNGLSPNMVGATLTPSQISLPCLAPRRPPDPLRRPKPWAGATTEAASHAGSQSRFICLTALTDTLRVPKPSASGGGRG